MAGELIEQRLDHEALAKSRFIDQFKNKAKLAALIASYAEQIQDLEDATFEVILERVLVNAVGVQLQTIARLVGAIVTTSDDDELRIIIQTQTAINLAHGTPEDLIKILILILINTNEVFRIREEPPHQVRMIIDDPLSTIVDPETALILLDSADVASIRILLDYFLILANDTFVYSDVNGASGTLGKGYADTGGGGTVEGALVSSTAGGK